MAQPTLVSENSPCTGMPPAHASTLLLQPVSHPELGDIRIDENLFAIGRTEAPFASYPAQFVADLSRRHARIFIESGTVYIADLDSKNGSTVNGVSVQQKITRLHDGDEICFAGRMCYRVRLCQAEMPAAPTRSAKLASLTLSPESDELGLQPIVISRFPFLVSKTDDVFARYKEVQPHQVNYLSRRHAHIFLKGSEPWIEDLGSTNGTFVNGKRLDEHAVRLRDGDVLAVGGHHFVYQVSLQQEAAAPEPTVTRMDAGEPSSPSSASSPAAEDKTTFVAAAGSFLDIFCVDHVEQNSGVQEDNRDTPSTEGAAGTGSQPLRQDGVRGRAAVLAAELTQAFSGGERRPGLGNWWRLPALAGALLAVVVLAYLANDPERELRGMLADGKYAQAASAAAAYLARSPEQAQLKALGTEALLKAGLPQWQSLLRARQFQRADAALVEMRRLARNNADVQPLLAELEWVGQLEQFVAARGGAEQPVRDGADGQRIQRLLRQWGDDTAGHQQAFTTIASYVPEFRDQYAQSLSHVRKLALVSGQQRKGGPDYGEQRQQPSEVAH